MLPSRRSVAAVSVRSADADPVMLNFAGLSADRGPRPRRGQPDEHRRRPGHAGRAGGLHAAGDPDPLRVARRHRGAGGAADGRSAAYRRRRRSFFANAAANSITVRATADVAGIVERVIAANDKPPAEIVIDVEIVEVSRERAKRYGLDLSQYSITATFSPESAPAAPRPRGREPARRRAGST